MRHQQVENIENLKERFTNQKKFILKAGAIFLAILLITLGFYTYSVKKQNDAKELEYEAYKYYFGLIKNSELTEQQRMQKAAELFIEAYNKKSNLTYLMNAGYAYEMAGQRDKAIETLRKVVNTSDPYFTNLARVKIAMIHLKNNEQTLAVNLLNEILNDKSDTMKDFSLFQLAKIYEQNNPEEANKYYDSLIRKFPESPFAQSAKNKIKESEKK